MLRIRALVKRYLLSCERDVELVRVVAIEMEWVRRVHTVCGMDVAF
jgi:hypothetical protein